MAPDKRDRIRVVIAEDQAMVLGALAALLEMEDDIEVVARAHSGDEALRLVQQNRPEVFITDIEMPGMTGLEVAAELKRRGALARVIILTTFARAGYLRRALEAGASGYLLKDMPAEQLADAVRRVRSGLRVIDPQLAAEAWTDEPDPLTDRERQVLRMAGEGVASSDIAIELNLSEGTVRNYLSEAINKLGAANRVEAARIARSRMAVRENAARLPRCSQLPLKVFSVSSVSLWLNLLGFGATLALRTSQRQLGTDHVVLEIRVHLEAELHAECAHLAVLRQHDRDQLL